MTVVTSNPTLRREADISSASAMEFFNKGNDLYVMLPITSAILRPVLSFSAAKTLLQKMMRTTRTDDIRNLMNFTGRPLHLGAEPRDASIVGFSLAAGGNVPLLLPRLFLLRLDAALVDHAFTGVADFRLTGGCLAPAQDRGSCQHGDQSCYFTRQKLRHNAPSNERESTYGRQGKLRIF
nr:hypothetical protein [uncultured Shinella sp.]